MVTDAALIKERADLAAIAGRYTKLRRTGKNLIGLCPFHAEKSPSFTISPEKGLWNCFGCGAGGDVFRFLELAEGVEFKTALRLAADYAGVRLDDRPPTPAESAAGARKQRAIELHLADARLWRRAAVSVAEDILDTLKAGLFSQSGADESRCIEIQNIERLLARLRGSDGAELVGEYGDWSRAYPQLVRGMVAAMRRRDRAERRALLDYLEQSHREADAA